jgi:phosphatidylglycerophosphatase C
VVLVPPPPPTRRVDSARRPASGNGSASSPPRDAPVVAAFDFDGTLSTRDNFIPFLCRVAGTPAVARALAASAVLTAGRGPSRSRNALKEQVVARLLSGMPARRLDMIGRAFAFDVLRRHLRADTVERVDWHRTQGHRLVIVTASLGVYVRPVAERLRFDAVLATELVVAPDGTLTGRLAGANVRGPEKARLLDAWLAQDPAYVWAYGDSSGDRELWARADHPVRVPKRRGVARASLALE